MKIKWYYPYAGKKNSSTYYLVEYNWFLADISRETVYGSESIISYQ